MGGVKDLRFRVWHVKENRMYYRGYQKFFHVLLCDDDNGRNDGKGQPVKRASYGDCVLLESTGLQDKNRKEIYEGDVVCVSYKGERFQDVVGSVPDMFGSRKVHPLQSVLKKHGISGNPENLEIEVLGNEFEQPELIEKIQAEK